MNLKNSSGILKKSGTFSKLIIYLIFILSGCAVIKHTPYGYTEKDLHRIFAGQKLLQDTFVVKYNIRGRGLSISGKARIEREDSFLTIRTYNFFTGKKILRFKLGNSGYGFLDFAGLYLFGANPLEKFSMAGDFDKNTFSFARRLNAIDTIRVRIREGHVVSVEEEKNNLLLFYGKNGKLSLVRGQMEGLSFEGVVIK